MRDVRRRAEDDDEPRDAPPVVVWAVAAGAAPLPFLAVYAVLFISRGTVHPVTPPDVGNSKTSELIAGIVALVLFVIGWLAAYWLLDARRRWPFLICQFALLAASVYFIADRTSGSPGVPILLTITSVAALVLALLPATWEYLQRDFPSAFRARRAAEPAAVPEQDTAEHIP
jgi:FtsH-binding integral membrane protein